MFSKEEFIELCQKFDHNAKGILNINGEEFGTVNVLIDTNNYSASVFMVNDEIGQKKILSLSDIEADAYPNDGCQSWVIMERYYASDEELLYVFNISYEDLMMLKLTHGMSDSSLQKLLSIPVFED